MKENRGGGGNEQLKKVFVWEKWGLVCVCMTCMDVRACVCDVCVMGDGLCVMAGVGTISRSGVWVHER